MTIVTNEEFLQACFGPTWTDAHVTGFAEDPGELEALGLKHYWGGTKWSRHHGVYNFPSQNAYFTISTFDDEPATGRSRRVKALHRATHVIVIDDIGTKIPVSALDGKPLPSWKLETSPGNYQWGYILQVPEADAGRVTALVDGLVAQGLCTDGKDPGMKGVTRYVRLPSGRNTKAKYGVGGFDCRLSLWAPNCRYTIEQLADRWNITLPAPGAVSVVAGRIAVDAKGDELLALLDQWGMVDGTRAADGVGFVCECPWVDYHTGRADSGSAYWLGGAFKCHHGHCDDKGRRELERWAHERLEVESGGLAGLSAWNFGVVPGYVRAYAPPAGGGDSVKVPTAAQAVLGIGTPSPVPAIDFGTGVDGRFFEEFVFISPEDRFLSLRTGELLTRAAVDFVWAGEMNGVGVLPFLSSRETMSPSKWFADVVNTARARCADKITYWPGLGSFFQDGGVRLANRWHPAERLGRSVTDADVEPWLRLVRHVVGGEGAGVVEQVLDWMALVVGAPGIKPGWHVVVQGGQGLGKDMMVQPVHWGTGLDNVGTVNAGSLHSQFNEWAERRLIVVNELKQNTKGSATGSDQYTTLKELTENTNDRIKINQKNMRPYYARNVGAFYVTSNDERAIALEADDRRFLVIMAGASPWPKAEYQDLADWMKRRGGAEMGAEWLHDRWAAMGVDRKRDLLGNAPATAGKVRMIANNEDPVTAWMREQIETGTWPDLMTGTDIAAGLAACAKSGTGGFGYVPGPQRWASALKGLGGGKVYNGNVVRLKSGAQARMWAVRAPGRFDNMGETQIAQAYVSAAGHAFSDGNDNVVTSLTSVQETASDASAEVTPVLSGDAT